MFSPLGHFKHINCPFARSDQTCPAKYCIFKHADVCYNKGTLVSHVQEENSANQREKIQDNQPLSLSSMCTTAQIRYVPSSFTTAIKDGTVAIKKDPQSNKVLKESFSGDQSTKRKDNELKSPSSVLAESTRPLKRTREEPPKPTLDRDIKKPDSFAIKLKERRTMNEPMAIPNPVYDSNAPAGHELRKRMVHIFYDAFLKLGYDAIESKEKSLEEEKNLCLSTNSKMVYSSSCKSKILSLKRSPPKEILEKKEDVSDLIPKLVHPKQQLELWGYNFGYINPSEPDDPLRECDRCGTKFVNLTGPCKYHWGKLFREKVGGEKIRVYTCCEVKEGESSGCTSEEFHVYRYQHLPYLANVSPYVSLSTDCPGKERMYCALDCELCYTTLGFELVHLTVVDKEGILLNQFIRPKGDVLSLNTRFSGITSKTQLESGISMREMYEKLKQLGITRNTIIIGHGIENDLNAMRLIHEQVIDTAILYKHERGPPFRYSLKYLTKRYLGKEIQTDTHHSEEDAIAAMDLVIYWIQKIKSRT
ncbi:exonuclease Rex3 [Schizosaccharomyces cryophilus OY26]|uniref:Exonuclease Rex3 n=1 Tax=Schizosaccharomyces cryophilus (strain OY26 / ATCC MYA-4695 / CBS 11777 / NBRC 106824 / NRRL Y48691) TaxID=653667 RepID=S9VQZ3_SCHCR|nr:exonuclease Rex3 [Schizosaccharomyces cryophilus OY26]EPY50348.1 exonuclease Rex3 [Schizosaccharomyces cryophilus OY26]